MKTITIDFDLYQEELRKEHSRGYFAAMADVRGLTGNCTYENWKRIKEEAWSNDNSDLATTLDILFPAYAKKEEFIASEIVF